jgi:GNAT superfamily N-acetyltransferase
MAPEDVDDARTADVSRLTRQLRDALSEISPGQLRAIAAHHVLVVAEAVDARRRRVIGMACLVSMNLPQGPRFLVESMVVDEAFCRLGIGTAILRALGSEAARRGGSRLSLTCNARRAAARRFHDAVGFVAAETTVLRRRVADG